MKVLLDTNAWSAMQEGDAAVERPDLLRVASAKIRAGEAATRAAEIAHQVHGAIGYTEEHQLHRFTLRLWAWRDEFGSETEWASWVGAAVARIGGEGLWRIADYATLNSNYLKAALARAGFEIAYPKRRASHEFIVTLRHLKEHTGVTAWDVAKRLLDKGFHAPTMYFPLLVPECLLIEPTETESKDTLDAFAAAMAEILVEAHEHPELVKSAPHTTPVRRLDEVRAAREPDLVWRGGDPGSAR